MFNRKKKLKVKEDTPSMMHSIPVGDEWVMQRHKEYVPYQVLVDKRNESFASNLQKIIEILTSAGVKLEDDMRTENETHIFYELVVTTEQEAELNQKFHAAFSPLD